VVVVGGGGADVVVVVGCAAVVVGGGGGADVVVVWGGGALVVAETDWAVVLCAATVWWTWREWCRWWRARCSAGFCVAWPVVVALVVVEVVGVAAAGVLADAPPQAAIASIATTDRAGSVIRRWIRFFCIGMAPISVRSGQLIGRGGSLH
jgi:hypothetical protein